MIKTNNILRTAIATCLGAVAGQAVAVLDVSVATPTGVTKIAKEIPNTTTTLVNAANQFDIKVAVPKQYVVNSANPLFVKLNLTNGASFATAPTSLRCGSAAAANSMSGLLQLGGAGTSFVVYSIETAVTVSGTCSATVGNINVSAGNFNSVSLSATIEYKNGLTDAVSGLTTNYVTFVKGMAASVISANSALVVDATTGSIKFASALSNLGSTALANLGVVQYAQVGTSAVSAGGANNVSAGDVLTSASVTVNGPAIAAALAVNGVSGLFLDAAASACTTKSYFIGSTAANSVTFAGVSLTDISAGVNVCINVSGGTLQIVTGQMTASVSGGLAAGVTADFSTTSNALETLTSNGTTKNAYFVNAASSTSKVTILRVINTGGNSGPLTVSAFDLSGAPYGTANASLGTLAIRQMATFDSAALETALGLTGASAPGPTVKYRVVISGGLAAYKILNYSKDVVSGSINLAQAQDD